MTNTLHPLFIQLLNQHLGARSIGPGPKLSTPSFDTIQADEFVCDQVSAASSVAYALGTPVSWLPWTLRPGCGFLPSSRYAAERDDEEDLDREEDLDSFGLDEDGDLYDGPRRDEGACESRF